jgi:glycosyltransferase involved in cell wall biosynthesis
MPPPPSPALADRTEPGRPALRLVDGRVLRTLILIPCLNEGPRIGGIVQQLAGLHPSLDILVVDDGSVDDTADAAAAAGAAVVRLPFNLGYGAALQTGYKYALEQGYDRLVQMDGDGQHPPEQVIHLLGALDEDEVDLAVGSRFLGRAEYRIPALRKIGIRFFGRLTSALVGQPVTDPTSGLQAMNRAVLAFYQQDFYPWDYPDADMLLRVHYAGLRFAEVPVVMVGGPPGKSMHRGMRPIYYVYKLLLSLALTWLSGSGRRTP